MNRREFLQTSGLITGATLLGNCSGTSQSKPAQHEGLDLLKNSGVRFVGDKKYESANKSFDFDAAVNDVAGHYTTITFMYGNCGTICPKNMAILKSISQKDPTAKHIIVSVDPIVDYPSVLNLHLDALGIPKENRIILYPTLTGSKNDYIPTQSLESLQKALQKKVSTAELSLNLLTLGDGLQDHNGVVKLYSPAGVHIKDSLQPSASDMVDELNELIVPIPAAAKNGAGK